MLVESVARVVVVVGAGAVVVVVVLTGVAPGTK